MRIFSAIKQYFEFGFSPFRNAFMKFRFLLFNIINNKRVIIDVVIRLMNVGILTKKESHTTKQCHYFFSLWVQTVSEVFSIYSDIISCTSVSLVR